MKNLKLKKFNLKKLFFTVSIFVIFNISTFAKSGFEFILNVPIGGSYSIISQNIKDYGMKNSIGLDAGIEAQFGGMFQVKENFAISVLGDIGFVHDIYAVKFKNDYYLKDYAINYLSFQIGLLPKFNIGRFSIGIGGGIKIPIFGGWDYTLNANAKQSPNYSFTKSSGVGLSAAPDNDNWTCGTSDYYADSGEIEEHPIISYAYVKLTFDYSIFFTDKVAMNIGLYFGYDFLPNEAIIITSSGNYEQIYTEIPKNYGTFNFGVQLGLRFGPKV